MNCKEKLEAYLRENQVPYEIQHHPAAFTAKQVAASEELPRKLMAKVVMVFADSWPVMLVLPASERVYLPEAARVLGAAEIRMADEVEFANLFPDCEVGAMPPFGNLYGVPVYVDKMLTEDEVIFFQAGTHTDTISLKYADFERLVKPTVKEFTWEEMAVQFMG